MSVLHYLDNEVPAFGEYDSVVEFGSSTIVQSADAAFGERPSAGSGFGLRNTIVGVSGAYVKKTLSYAMPPGGWIYLGLWVCPRIMSAGIAYPLPVGLKGTSANTDFYSRVSGGSIQLVARNDGGSGQVTGWHNVLVADRWFWLVFALRRSTSAVANDGEFALYCDGVLLDSRTGKDFYDRFVTLDYLCVGGGKSASVFDFDEIKIADSAVGTGYPEPFVPTPLTEYPEARRTVVLFRQNNSDSRDFADYCVEQLDVPRCNLCPLPNATANETLADYATFQTEVETDLAAWLALNPTVAANCSCFLLGHGVPGYFTHSGTKHSAVSRLMNYGTAFSSQMDNPLYNPATVARLTKTALGGKYLCTRIDADTLAHSKDILDAGLTASALSVLPATDKLFSDDATYTASLACQHLRIITEGLGAFADDAFVWGDCGTHSFGSAGSRAVFTDDSADSADTLRATSELFDAIVTNGYAAGLGFSAGAGCLVPGAFFEMLRIGGSLAEAFAVAVAKLDHTAVAVGSPLMTVAFGLGGYNIYRGIGGVEGIDWENPIAYLMPAQSSITLSQDLLPGQRYVYAVRAVSSAGVEEHNTCVIIYVQTDDQGNLLPAPLARPKDITADVQQNSLLIGFSYCAPLGFADADGFDVLGDNGTGQMDLDNPVATIERSQNDRFDFEVSINRPDTPVLLAVRARRGEQVGPVSELVSVPLIPSPTSIRIL